MVASAAVAGLAAGTGSATAEDMLKTKELVQMPSC
jgi:hypothetical protein